MKKILFLGMACFLLSMTACNNKAGRQESQEIQTELAEQGNPVNPNFKYEVVDNMFVPQGVPMVVDFYADWCGPCKQYAPIFEKAMQKYGNVAIFERVNVDEMQDIASAYNINSIPTTVFIMPSGSVLGSQTGILSEQTIDSYMNQLLADTAGEGQSL